MKAAALVKTVSEVVAKTIADRLAFVEAQAPVRTEADTFAGVEY